jgi:hypothetical protein
MAWRWHWGLVMQLRQIRTTLSCSLIALLPLGVLAPGCSPSSSSQGQLITCTTDPGTGVIVRCEPGGTGSGSGVGSGSGGGTCQDVDKDGDGEPHDDGDDNSQPPVMATGGSDDGSDHDQGDDNGDHDNDGIPDNDDCDEHPGEDAHRQGLPYDIRPQLGATTSPILDAFAARGGQAPQVVSVAMQGGTWRLAELQAGTAFVVTQADCTHAGNRDTGRDRVTVTWKNTDQSTSSDHLDIRYCK